LLIDDIPGGSKDTAIELFDDGPSGGLKLSADEQEKLEKGLVIERERQRVEQESKAAKAAGQTPVYRLDSDEEDEAGVVAAVVPTEVGVAAVVAPVEEGARDEKGKENAKDKEVEGEGSKAKGLNNGVEEEGGSKVKWRDGKAKERGKGGGEVAEDKAGEEATGSGQGDNDEGMEEDMEDGELEDGELKEVESEKTLHQESEDGEIQQEKDEEEEEDADADADGEAKTEGKAGKGKSAAEDEEDEEDEEDAETKGKAGKGKSAAEDEEDDEEEEDAETKGKAGKGKSAAGKGKQKPSEKGTGKKRRKRKGKKEPENEDTDEPLLPAQYPVFIDLTGDVSHASDITFQRLTQDVRTSTKATCMTTHRRKYDIYSIIPEFVAESGLQMSEQKLTLKLWGPDPSAPPLDYTFETPKAVVSLHSEYILLQ
jgi:hypothetical protein